MNRTWCRGLVGRLVLPVLAGLALLGPASAEPIPPVPAEASASATVGSPHEPLRVDFRGALKAAVDSSPELEASRAQVESARWTTEEARSAGNPTVGIEGTYTRLDREVATTLSGRSFVVSPQDSYRAALVLRQAVATFGRLHYAVLAGQMAERAALEEYRSLLANELASSANIYLVALLA